jgi:hypothetical protein
LDQAIRSSHLAFRSWRFASRSAILASRSNFRCSFRSEAERFPLVLALDFAPLDLDNTFSTAIASSAWTLRLRGLGAESVLERLERLDLEGRGDIVSKVAGDPIPMPSL